MAYDNTLGVNLCHGWTWSNKTCDDGEILVVNISKKPASLRWCLSKSRKLIPLTSTPIIRLRMGAAIAARKKRQLIYWREQGIVGYDLTAKKEKLLVALDKNRFRAGQFWLNESEHVLYFIREKYTPSWDAILDVLKKSGKSPGFKVNCSLLTYSFEEAKCRTIIDFHGSSPSVLVDTRDGLVYYWSKRKIIIADLHSGRIKKTVPEPEIVKLARLPSGNILVWGFHADIAYQIDSAGRRKATAFRGMFPACSPDGKGCVYWKRDGRLVLAGAAKTPECVLSRNAFKEDSWTGLQPPAWSPRGKYFAIMLDTPDISGRPKISLLVFDPRSKTASLRAQNITDFVWL